MRTHGCQMNVHDSERLASLLETAGYVDLARACPGRPPRGRRRHRLQPAPSARTPTTSSTATSASCGPPRRPTPTSRSPSAAAPGAEGPRDDRHPRPLGRRGLRHPQHRQPPGPARPCAAQQAGGGRDPQSARDLPVNPADPARLGLRRLGVDLGGLQQHLRSASSRACAARTGPSTRRGARRGRGPRRAGGRRDHPARPERQHLRRRVRRPARVREAAAGLRRGRGPGAGALHGPHPAAFTDDVIAAMAETPNVMPNTCTCRAVRLRPRAEGDAAVLLQREVPRHHRQGPRGHPGRRDHR